ncbi:hypothetical protein HG535_0D05960 [Zygotorulaspora mrakii]|uniref:Major facilitator superfamily (MFS) profile domain-containing protein n=1 Tax=Zygotorulaspora mrakii TaxID=42260 RepID=A0A7H9B319_ZYGMR|nr:uncharacterized protein HG535_0D05960 [Zygotorulaspora mrakii]QLG72887.1 hypothetical protein HG535_0D05960 [Zygotorulaspora mrakii]
MLKILGSPTYSVRKISAIVSISGFVMGMDISSLALFIGTEGFETIFEKPNPIEQGLLVGASPLGGLVGCLLYGILVRRIDRVTLFRLGAMIWIKGSILNVLAFNIWILAVSRWIKGLAAGLFSILLAAYIGEVVPKEKKGKSMAFVQLSFASSILVIYYVSVSLNYFQMQLAARLTWSLEMIPAVLLLVSTIWLPESPEWLILHGQYDKAEEIQNNLALQYNKENKNCSAKLLNKLDLALIYEECSSEFKFRDFIKENCCRQTIMGSVLQLLVQFSGINILMYYITFICDMIGLEGSARIASASIPYVINCFLSLLPITFLDHVRRKDITLAGSFPLGILMITIGTLMAVYGHQVEPINGNKSLIWAVDRNTGPLILGLCYLFIAIFSVTLSCGPWIYTNEILPPRSKAKALPICMSAGWLANFSLTLLAPTMMVSLKWGTFILLGAVTLLISIAILVLFPETKYLSRTEIDLLYAKNKVSKATKPERPKDQSSISSSDPESPDTSQHLTPIVIEDQRT